MIQIGKEQIGLWWDFKGLRVATLSSISVRFCSSEFKGDSWDNATLRVYNDKSFIIMQWNKTEHRYDVNTSNYTYEIFSTIEMMKKVRPIKISNFKDVITNYKYQSSDSLGV